MTGGYQRSRTYGRYPRRNDEEYEQERSELTDWKKAGAESATLGTEKKDWGDSFCQFTVFVDDQIPDMDLAKYYFQFVGIPYKPRCNI